MVQSQATCGLPAHCRGLPQGADPALLASLGPGGLHKHDAGPCTMQVGECQGSRGAGGGRSPDPCSQGMAGSEVAACLQGMRK